MCGVCVCVSINMHVCVDIQYVNICNGVLLFLFLRFLKCSTQNCPSYVICWVPAVMSWC